MSTRRMLMIATAISILIVQEYVLMILPNVQFTIVLLIIFVSLFTFEESIALITGYVCIDMSLLGGLNPMYVIPMLYAWWLIPISYHTFLRRTNSELKLALFAMGFGFVYGWMFLPFKMLEQGIWNPLPYLIADIPYEIIMSMTGFITVYWLYVPLRRVLFTVMHGHVPVDVKS